MPHHFRQRVNRHSLAGSHREVVTELVSVGRLARCGLGRAAQDRSEPRRRVGAMEPREKHVPTRPVEPADRAQQPRRLGSQIQRPRPACRVLGLVLVQPANAGVEIDLRPAQQARLGWSATDVEDESQHDSRVPERSPAVQLAEDRPEIAQADRLRIALRGRDVADVMRWAIEPALFVAPTQYRAGVGAFLADCARGKRPLSQPGDVSREHVRFQVAEKYIAREAFKVRGDVVGEIARGVLVAPRGNSPANGERRDAFGPDSFAFGDLGPDGGFCFPPDRGAVFAAPPPARVVSMRSRFASHRPPSIATLGGKGGAENIKAGEVNMSVRKCLSEWALQDSNL